MNNTYGNSSENAKKRKKKKLCVFDAYLLASAFCVVFGAVYEIFSHGVYTPYMYLAFLIPFLGGALPFFIIRLSKAPRPAWISVCLHAFGIAVLTVGCIMQGALVIYGTTNRLMSIYLIAGLISTALGIFSYGLALTAHRQS